MSKERIVDGPDNQNRGTLYQIDSFISAPPVEIFFKNQRFMSQKVSIPVGITGRMTSEIKKSCL
jgi:hypothetical protein